MVPSCATDVGGHAGCAGYHAGGGRNGDLATDLTVGVRRGPGREREIPGGTVDATVGGGAGQAGLGGEGDCGDPRVVGRLAAAVGQGGCGCDLHELLVVYSCIDFFTH